MPDPSTEGAAALFPGEPLRSKFVRVGTELGLARFVERHPELCDAVVRTLLEMTCEYHEAMSGGNEEEEEEEEGEEEETQASSSQGQDGEQEQSSQQQAGEALAEQLAKEMEQKWGPATRGLGVLDGLFGTEHGLLSPDQGGVGDSFGLQDGVWRHTGWTELSSLGQLVRDMPELRKLLQSLGRRAAVESGRRARVPKEKERQGGRESVGVDDLVPSEMTGVTFTGDISRMLPSEAILLKARVPGARLDFLSKVITCSRVWGGV